MENFKGDGAVDVLISNIDAAPVLLRNNAGRQGRWLGVRLVWEKTQIPMPWERASLTRRAICCPAVGRWAMAAFGQCATPAECSEWETEKNRAAGGEVAAAQRSWRFRNLPVDRYHSFRALHGLRTRASCCALFAQR